MNEWLLYYIVINIAFVFLSSVVFQSFSWVNPIIIYNNIPVNWFGAIIITIVVNLVFSAVAVCYWFYKLMTVGRKDD